MAKLPVLSGDELVHILKRVIRQKGSHVSLQKDGYRTVVPLHDELARGTLLAILKQCGMSRDDLLNLM